MENVMFYILLAVIVIVAIWACKLIVPMTQYKEKNMSTKRKFKANLILLCGVLCIVGYIVYMFYIFSE